MSQISSQLHSFSVWSAPLTVNSTQLCASHCAITYNVDFFPLEIFNGFPYKPAAYRVHLCPFISLYQRVLVDKATRQSFWSQWAIYTTMWALKNFHDKRVIAAEIFLFVFCKNFKLLIGYIFLPFPSISTNFYLNAVIQIWILLPIRGFLPYILKHSKLFSVLKLG